MECSMGYRFCRFTLLTDQIRLPQPGDQVQDLDPSVNGDFFPFLGRHLIPVSRHQSMVNGLCYSHGGLFWGNGRIQYLVGKLIFYPQIPIFSTAIVIFEIPFRYF